MPRFRNDVLVEAAARRGDHTDAMVARRLGVAYVTAWRLRRLPRVPAASTLTAIERAYGLTAAQLIADEQPTEASA